MGGPPYAGSCCSWLDEHAAPRLTAPVPSANTAARLRRVADVRGASRDRSSSGSTATSASRSARTKVMGYAFIARATCHFWLTDARLATGPRLEKLAREPGGK